MTGAETNEYTESRARRYLRKAGLTDEQIEALARFGYFDAPASKRNHLSHRGGLVEHSMNVADNLIALHVFEDEVSAYRVGMLHDLVKCANYVLDEVSMSYEKRPSCYPGHGTASVLHAADLGIGLTEEERHAIIWHMGAFAVRDRDTNDAYDRAKLLFPRQVVLTHAADHLAAATEEAAEAANGRG